MLAFFDFITQLTTGYPLLNLISTNLRLRVDGAASERSVLLDLGVEWRLDAPLTVPHLVRVRRLPLRLLRRELLEELRGLLDTPGIAKSRI